MNEKLQKTIDEDYSAIESTYSKAEKSYRAHQQLIDYLEQRSASLSGPSIVGERVKQDFERLTSLKNEAKGKLDQSEQAYELGDVFSLFRLGEEVRTALDDLKYNMSYLEDL